MITMQPAIKELIENRDHAGLREALSQLIAEASLHAEKLGLYYLQNGANIHHAGCNGGTALHWASWCGRDMLVKELINKGSDINRRCIEFGATPLGWAVHGFRFGGETNRHHQIECAKLLIKGGADKNIPNAHGKIAFDYLSDGDAEFKNVFNNLEQRKCRDRS